MNSESLVVRAKAVRGTIEYELIKALKRESNQKGQSVKELVMEMLRMLRLPQALATSKDYSKEEKDQIWLESIYALEAQKMSMIQRSGLNLAHPQIYSNNLLSRFPSELEEDEEQEPNLVSYQDITGLSLD